MAEPIDVSRPLSIADLLDGGWELFRREWALLLLFVGLPSLLINLWKPDASQPDQAGGVLLMSLAAMVGYMVIYGAARSVLQSAVRGERADAGRALALGLRRLPASLGTLLLLVLVGMVAILALVVPFLILMIYMLFVLDAVVLRGRSGPNAMRYSHALVKGQWWRTLGIFLVIMLPFLLLGILMSMFDGGPIYVALLIANALLGPFLSAALTLYFFNRDALVNPPGTAIAGEQQPLPPAGTGTATPAFEAPRPC